MVKMSLPAVPKELTLEQLEICLIALDVFHGLINNPVLQPLLIEEVQKAEKFYGLNFNLHDALSDLDKFSDVSVGLTCDKLFDLHENLESSAFSN